MLHMSKYTLTATLYATAISIANDVLWLALLHSEPLEKPIETSSLSLKSALVLNEQYICNLPHLARPVKTNSGWQILLASTTHLPNNWPPIALRSPILPGQFLPNWTGGVPNGLGSFSDTHTDQEQLLLRLAAFTHNLSVVTAQDQADRLLLYWTAESKKQDALMVFPYYREVLEEVGAHVDQVVARILAKDFTIKKPPEPKVSKECDFRLYCRHEGNITVKERDL